jgi:hypothetical protein
VAGRTVKPGPGSVGIPSGGTDVRFVVVIFNVVVAAPVPVGVTVEGDATQLASFGKPLQVIVTAELKPPVGLILTARLAEFPAANVTVGELTARLKSPDGPKPPVPVSRIT